MTGGSFAFTDNAVLDPLESAVLIRGPYAVGALTFAGLTVSGAALIADIRPDAKGTTAFTAVIGTGAAFALTYP